MNIKFESSVKGVTLEEVSANFVKELPLSKLANIVKEEIQGDTIEKGWERIEKTVKTRKVDDTTYEIYLGGKDAEISGYLQTGTQAHLVTPKDKKALSWVNSGKRYFSKGHRVSGIKATHFFKITDEAFTKMARETSEFIRRIFTK